MSTSQHDLTERQRDVLDYIVEFLREAGYPPTIREIADHFGMASPFGIQRHLSELQRKGYLRRESGARRALTLSPGVLEDLADGASHLPARPPVLARMAPILGKVAAGLPISAQQAVDDHIALPESWFKGTDLFVLRVQGDSMAPGIESGDLVVVRPQSTAENGTLVVALLDTEATVKRFFRERQGIVLRSDNPAYADIHASHDCQIQGKVTGLLRHY